MFKIQLVFTFQMELEIETFLQKIRRQNLQSTPIPKRRVADGNLIMMTIRTHDQYNTTIYGMDRSLVEEFLTKEESF